MHLVLSIPESSWEELSAQNRARSSPEVNLGGAFPREREAETGQLFCADLRSKMCRTAAYSASMCCLVRVSPTEGAQCTSAAVTADLRLGLLTHGHFLDLDRFNEIVSAAGPQGPFDRFNDSMRHRRLRTPPALLVVLSGTLWLASPVTAQIGLCLGIATPPDIICEVRTVPQPL